MSGTIRLGVVGVRNIGKGHIRNAQACPGAEVTALADTDPERLAAAAKESDVARTYTDAADLFADPDVDGVILALPNHLHEPLTLQALAAGKHVLIEKPISRTVAEAERMIAARDQSGKVLMVGMNQRFQPLHQAAKRAIEAGEIGRVQYAKTQWTLNRPFDGLWERGAWFLQPESSGGGPLLDMGVHRLDLALYLIGFPKVESVSGALYHGIGAREAERRGKAYGIEDGGLGFVRLEDGSSIVLEASYFRNDDGMRQQTTIYGTDGTIHLDQEATLIRLEDDEWQRIPLEPVTSGPQSCAAHFVRVLRGEEALSPTAEQGLVSMRIIESIYAGAPALQGKA